MLLRLRVLAPIFVIGLVDTYTLQAVDSAVVFDTL